MYIGIKKFINLLCQLYDRDEMELIDMRKVWY